MKQLLFLFFCFMSFVANAQNDTTKYFKSYDYGWSYPRIQIRNAFILPSDTINNKLGTAVLNGSLYNGDGVKWTIMTGGGGKNTNAFGSFFDSTTQTIASTTIAYPIRIAKTDTAYKFHITNNQIIADTPGLYNLQWSGQFQNTDNAENDVSVWIRKNGVNVVGSTGFISIPKKIGQINGHTIASWNYIVTMDAGDSIVFYWQATNTGVSLQYYPQQTSPTRPSTASVLATITPIVAGTITYNDTAAMLNPYLRKVDTTAMLSKYLRKYDTTAMINPYLRKYDTTEMLNPYFRKFDTTAMLSKYLRKYDTTAMLNPYLRKFDTTTMLNPYLRKFDTTTMLNPYLRKYDTTAMLSKYLRKFDTTAMLNPYLRKFDTTAMLNTYLKKYDTTAMLNPYFRKFDTTAMLNPYLRKYDTTNKFVNKLERIIGKDSIIFYIGSTRYVIKDSTGSGNPAGNNGYVQFNNSGSFGGDSSLFWNNTNKRLGIGTTQPRTKLDVALGKLGNMPYNYEIAAFEKNGDVKFGVYNADNYNGSGSSVILGNTKNVNANGNYPGFEFQNVNDSENINNSYVRYNYLERATGGNVVAANVNLLNIYADGKVEINPSSFGLSVTPRLIVGDDITGANFEVSGNAYIASGFTLGGGNLNCYGELYTHRSVNKHILFLDDAEFNEYYLESADNVVIYNTVEVSPDLYLPEFPNQGQEIIIKQIGDIETYHVNVYGNGHNIFINNTAVGSFVIDTGGLNSLTLIYDSNGSGFWYALNY